jgi:hypothetical protein
MKSKYCFIFDSFFDILIPRQASIRENAIQDAETIFNGPSMSNFFTPGGNSTENSTTNLSHWTVLNDFDVKDVAAHRQTHSKSYIDDAGRFSKTYRDLDNSTNDLRYKLQNIKPLATSFSSPLFGPPSPTLPGGIANAATSYLGGSWMGNRMEYSPTTPTEDQPLTGGYFGHPMQGHKTSGLSKSFYGTTCGGEIESLLEKERSWPHAF